MNKYARRKILYVYSICALLFLSGCSSFSETTKDISNAVNSIQNDVTENTSSDPFKFFERAYKEGESYINSADDIELKCTDGKSKNYSFTYNGEKYTAVYIKDNWHINNSYKIRNKKDITYICEALIAVHPIHGADMKSYRSAEDMMDEWVKHNVVYDYLPEGSSWKNQAKDVDLNPADQGKSIKEMYESRVNEL